MANKQIVPVNLSPDELFGKRVFRIPDYQRGYAWESQQLNEFIEDVELIPDKGTHYTGTIVVHAENQDNIERDEHGKKYDIFNIVDGQQRLTTIVIILEVIRREFSNIGKSDLAKGLLDTYICITDRNKQPMAKLQLNKDCHEFFFNTILQQNPTPSGPTIRSHNNLQNANKIFSEYFKIRKKELKQEFPIWLENFRNKICDQLVLTLYEFSNEADAGVIFEVMNNRGKPITEFDKTKNYLLYLCSKIKVKGRHNLIDKINQTWAYIFTRLMAFNLTSSDYEEQLLRMDWIVRYDSNSKNWDGSKSIKKHFHLKGYVNKHTELLEELKKYTEGLYNAATAYTELLNPEHSDSFSDMKENHIMRLKIINMAQKLVRLGNLAPFLPLLMAVRLKYPTQGDCLLKILELFEKYSFRIFCMMQKRADAGKTSLESYAKKFHTSEMKEADVIKNIKITVGKYSPPKEYSLKLTEIGDWYTWKGLRYLLYEYENKLCNEQKRPMKIDWKKDQLSRCPLCTIEHILPQDSSNPYWKDHFSKDEIDDYLHDIGNLCLTLDNSSYGKKSFTEKKGHSDQKTKCYAIGELIMEKDLSAYSHWDVAAICDRRKKILDWAEKRWGIEYIPEKLHEINEELDEIRTDEGDSVMND